jgi:aminoglycoside phosphotransferase (APT) family kinase protein
MNIHSILQKTYTHQFPDLNNPVISSLSQINEGWESEVYCYDVEHGPVDARRKEKLILRIYPGSGGYEKSGSEFQGMQILHQAGYPVPKVFHLVRENSPFGKPFVIMERVDGELLWSLMDAAHPEQMQEYIRLFCKLFSQLHRLKWRAYIPNPDELAPDDPYFFVNRELNKFRSYQSHYPIPGFLPVSDWLVARADQVPCRQAAVVHLDFHPANIIVQTETDGKIDHASVIDWTNLNISDARFDIAWTSLLTYAYAGSLLRESILQEYERQSGERIENLPFFETAACVRRL